jgi:hypothetical protein
MPVQPRPQRCKAVRAPQIRVGEIESVGENLVNWEISAVGELGTETRRQQLRFLFALLPPTNIGRPLARTLAFAPQPGLAALPRLVGVGIRPSRIIASACATAAALFTSAPWM